MNGAELIAAERQRQMEVEHYSPADDDQYEADELCWAAQCYIVETCDPGNGSAFWPWEPEYWKPKDAVANLVRAGALIAAEIDRLGRAAEKEGERE